MLVMSYNILLGGTEPGEDRTPLLLEVIRQANPTILGLCECKGFDADHGARLDLFCRELGMEAVMNRAEDGNHVALFYRQGLTPRSSSTTDSLMQHGVVRVTFDSDELGPIAIVLTHLHAFSSVFRVAEAQMVLGKAFGEREALILGDMNALAGGDLPLDLSSAPPALHARLSAPDNSLDTQVIATFLQHGFQDLGAGVVGPTYSTPIGNEAAPQGPLVRLDYAFATPGLAARCHSIAALRDEPAPRASDHLPVFAEFDLTLSG